MKANKNAHINVKGHNCSTFSHRGLNYKTGLHLKRAKTGPNFSKIDLVRPPLSCWPNPGCFSDAFNQQTLLVFRTHFKVS